MGDDKYQLCPCGSGKKLKFCCFETLGQSSNAELLRRASEFAVHESRVSANWQTAGLAEVLVVRRATNLKYVVGAYLVDVFCLGLKNTLARATFNYEDIQAMERGFQRMKEISYEDARSIILGAVEYARRLGFEPHEDWTLSGPIIEAGKPYMKKFTFGKDGKPFYIQGPHDDVRKTMEKLGPLIKEKKAGYVCVTGPIFDDDLAGDGTEASFDERCDRVEQDLKDGVFEGAQDEIEALIDEYPGRWEPVFLMGTCLAMQGNSEQAIPFLKLAATLHPSAEVYYNLAAAHQSLFQIREVFACMEKVIELDGPDGEIGKKAKAEIKALTAAICSTSGIPLDQYLKNAGWFDEAFVCLMDGRLEEAVRGFNLVLQSQPNHVQSHGNLGIAYARLGDRDAAIRHLDKAIELDPKYQPAIDNRRIVLDLRPGERLQHVDGRDIDFYGDRARKERSSRSRSSRRAVKSCKAPFGRPAGKFDAEDNGPL